MAYPSLSHLQFQVLGILRGGEQSGRDIRAELAAQGVKKSGPAFYQFMARLEDAGFVKGYYVRCVLDGQAVKERYYKVSGSGVRAWDTTRDFYAAQIASVAGRTALG